MASGAPFKLTTPTPALPTCENSCEASAQTEEIPFISQPLPLAANHCGYQPTLSNPGKNMSINSKIPSRMGATNVKQLNSDGWNYRSWMSGPPNLKVPNQTTQKTPGECESTNKTDKGECEALLLYARIFSLVLRGILANPTRPAYQATSSSNPQTARSSCRPARALSPQDPWERKHIPQTPQSRHH